MRRWLLILAVIFTAFTPLGLTARTVHAQTAISFQSMMVEIWPEYDRPSVLVIYRITLSPDVKLPAEITLRIPQSAGRPSAVAEQTSNGLFNLSYNLESQSDGWYSFKFTTTLPQIEFEYYDPSLTKSVANHHYTFNWTGDYAVQDMNIDVQQPRTATAMQVQPNIGISGPGTDNLVYFHIPVGSVSSGGTFKLDVSYQKSDDTLTQPSSFESVTPAAPVDQNTLGRVNFNETIPWAIGGLGLLLIVVGGVWYWRSNRKTVSAAPAQARRRKSAAAVLPSEGTVFCHKCGKRAGPDDVFCRSCGVRLKR